MYEKTICGLDETGLGALAGPLVVAAVVLPVDFSYEFVAPDVVIRDSKKLSKIQRKKALQVIKSHSLQIEIEVMSVSLINEMGSHWADREAFRRLITKIDASRYVIDGTWTVPDPADKQPLISSIPRADELFPSTMAAGIVAKVAREAIMEKLHQDYPMYGWNTNTGHGTREHIEAIRKYNQCEHHRTKFVATALRNVSKE